MAVYLGNNQIDMFGGSGIVQPTLQTKAINPSESIQNITADSGYDGLDEVIVQGIPLDYVGSGINQRDSSDLITNGPTVIVPEGYYGNEITKTIANGSAGTPTATKGTVNNHAVSVTSSVTNTTGYITGGTKTGTAVSVSASELVSGNLAITSNGTGINVANYSTVSVDVASNPNIETLTQTINSSGITSISYTVKGRPKAFFLQLGNNLGTVYSAVLCVSYNGTTTTGVFNPSDTTCYYNTAIFSFTYSGTTLTINVGKYGSDQIYFYGRYGGTYNLTYVY